jgi:hypothetical protein
MKPSQSGNILLLLFYYRGGNQMMNAAFYPKTSLWLFVLLGFLFLNSSALAFDEFEEAELEGRIRAIDDILRQMTISDKIVKTTDGTSFLDDEGQAITFEDFVVNDYVEVDGFLNQDGSVQAATVGKETGDPECEDQLSDRITGISAGEQTVRIGRIIVLINSLTVIEPADGSPGTFDDLEIGQSVELTYCPDLGAPALARKIEVKDEPVDTEIELQGPITDIELLTGSMTVNGSIIIVTGNPTLLDEQGQVITFEDFELQDYVEVEGALQADETVLAEKVKIEDKDRDDCAEKIRAFVNEIDAANNRLVTGLITVRVDADTEITDDESGLTLTLADLVAGDSVKIEYCPGAGEPLAFEIERKAAGDFDLDDDDEVGQSDVLQIQRKRRQGGTELDLDGDNRTTGRDMFLFSTGWKQ